VPPGFLSLRDDIGTLHRASAEEHQNHRIACRGTLEGTSHLTTTNVLPHTPLISRLQSARRTLMALTLSLLSAAIVRDQLICQFVQARQTRAKQPWYSELVHQLLALLLAISPWWSAGQSEPRSAARARVAVREAECRRRSEERTRSRRKLKRLKGALRWQMCSVFETT